VTIPARDNADEADAIVREAEVSAFPRAEQEQANRHGDGG
jgi:hypothetical protein